MKHGQGKLNFPDGRCYEGNFDENDINGKGKLVWPDGTTY